MIEDRSAKIRSLGAEYFEQIIGEEETLHLEFKTLPHDGRQLTREDKKTIGKAISGMANAEGGVVILGIETKTSDGIDIAVAKRAIKQLQRTTSRVRAYMSDVLSPQHTGIAVFCFDELGKQDEGFIIIDVPPSANRPHYSNAHHRYFRRGSNGTRVLEHHEIRELMFAAREGNIEVRVSGKIEALSGDRISALILLSVHNTGPIPVTAPYLKVTPDLGQWTRAPQAPNSEVRRIPPVTIGIYNPLVRIRSQAMNDMLRYGAAFGLTPSGRLRLSGITSPPPPSKFDGLLG